MKITYRNTLILFLAGIGLAVMVRPTEAKKIQVVATLTDYAYLAQEVGGDRVEVQYIVQGNQDAHFVKPKPSYAVMLKEADLLVSTGLDLELWLPALIDKSGNRHIRSGQKGYVQAAAGLHMLEKPAGRPDRSEGDIHIHGNPHIHTSPVNVRIIAHNIVIGLKKVDPAGARYYDQREKAFRDRLDKALFGETLVQMLGGDVLIRLLQQKKLHSFLKSKGVSGVFSVAATGTEKTPLFPEIERGERQTRRMVERGGAAARTEDRGLPQELGLLRRHFRSADRDLHRTQARDPTHAGTRQPGHQNRQRTGPSGHSDGELLRTRQTRTGGPEDRRESSHRGPGRLRRTRD